MKKYLFFYGCPCIPFMLSQANSCGSKKDLRARQHLLERSFAQATRNGFKRSRWWRLWRVQIQEYLTAAIQNLKILLKDVKDPATAMQMRVAKEVGDNASRTKLYGRGSQSSLQWNGIAGFCRCLEKLLPHHYHTESIGWIAAKSNSENKKHSPEFVLEKYRFRQQSVLIWSGRGSDPSLFNPVPMIKSLP